MGTGFQHLRRLFSSQSEPQRRRRKSLGMERLEVRVLLASDTLGAITGTVALDVNNNNVIDAGEEQVGVTMQLFEDTNNNNSFDAGTDTLVSTANTDANGDYEFEMLASNNYFVVQPAQTVGTTSLTQQVSPRKSIDGNGVPGTSVDAFTSQSGPTVDVHPPGTPVDSVNPAPDAIGGERDFEVELTSGIPGTEVQIQTLGGLLDFGTPNIQPLGDYLVTWDGVDAVGAGLNPTGLGGIDLTEIGGTTGLGQGLCLTDVQFDQLGAMVNVRVYTDGGQFSEATIGSVPAFSTNDYFIPFTGTSPAGLGFTPVTGGGADFTNVGAIELEIIATQQATNGVVNLFGVVGTDPEVCDFINPAPQPSIGLEKATNGVDADNSTDPNVPVINLNNTNSVTWTYTVTNTGQTPLNNVQLNDNIEGTIADTNIISQSINNDNVLDIGEVWVYELTGTATEGLYNNVATVTAVSDTQVDVQAQDPSHYRGIRPAIDIEKLTNNVQADNPSDPDVPQINEGAPVTWNYIVTNTSTDLLTNVTVTDDQLGSISNIISQSINADNVLDPGEVWTYEANGTAIVGNYSNLGTVMGTASDGTSVVTDSDPSNYVGISQQPAIDIEKSTNGIDADTPGSGPQVIAGSTVTFGYVVTNPGEVPLSGVVVEDDAGTPADPTDDFFATFVSGDINNDNLLDVGETWTFTATSTAVVGAYQNIATVNGTAPNGTTIVTANDPSNYTGIELQPAIDIEKSTNGVDADTVGSGPQVISGTTVTFGYVVTNPGEVPLSGVVVEDDAGTPTDPTDNFFATFVSGDTNNDNLLDIGETWTFTATSTAILGPYRNEATVRGTAPNGTTVVTADDPSNYTGILAPSPVSKRRFLATFFETP